jgi:hypothetical protein
MKKNNLSGDQLIVLYNQLSSSDKKKISRILRTKHANTRHAELFSLLHLNDYNLILKKAKSFDKSQLHNVKKILYDLIIQILKKNNQTLEKKINDLLDEIQELYRLSLYDLALQKLKKVNNLIVENHCFEYLLIYHKLYLNISYAIAPSAYSFHHQNIKMFKDLYDEIEQIKNWVLLKYAQSKIYSAYFSNKTTNEKEKIYKSTLNDIISKVNKNTLNHYNLIIYYSFLSSTEFLLGNYTRSIELKKKEIEVMATLINKNKHKQYSVNQSYLSSIYNLIVTYIHSGRFKEAYEQYFFYFKQNKLINKIIYQKDISLKERYEVLSYILESSFLNLLPQNEKNSLHKIEKIHDFIVNSLKYKNLLSQKITITLNLCNYYLKTGNWDNVQALHQLLEKYIYKSENYESIRLFLIQKIIISIEKKYESELVEARIKSLYRFLKKLSSPNQIDLLFIKYLQMILKNEKDIYRIILQAKKDFHLILTQKNNITDNTMLSFNWLEWMENLAMKLKKT